MGGVWNTWTAEQGYRAVAGLSVELTSSPPVGHGGNSLLWEGLHGSGLLV